MLSDFRYSNQYFIYALDLMWIGNNLFMICKVILLLDGCSASLHVTVAKLVHTTVAKCKYRFSYRRMEPEDWRWFSIALEEHSDFK